MITESAFLELDTYSLPASDINTQRTIYTFRNIDLRKIMGVMWDKYDKFTLKLHSRRMSGTTLTSGSQYYAVEQYMKGLDWINLYDERTYPGTQYACIANMAVQSAGAGYLPPNNGYGFNFRKSAPIVNLEFILEQVSVAGMAMGNATTDIYGQTAWTFLIEPAENNLNEMGSMTLYTGSTFTNSNKIITDNAKTFTYPAFNMRNVCSEFWDKYEDYEIFCAGYMVQGPGTTTDDQSLTPIQMSGFSWVNNLTKQNADSYSTSKATVALTKSGVSGSDHRFSIANQFSPVQFKKSGDTINLQYQFMNFDSSSLNTFNQVNRRCCLQFFIRPIIPQYNPEKAILSLNSSGLTTTMSNLGIRNSNYTDITIKNINIKQACQNIWDKYDKFNIFFTGICSSALGYTKNDVFVNLYCEGLPTDPQYEDNQTTTIWNVGSICTYDNGTQGRPTSYGYTHSTTFYKTKDIIDLHLFVADINASSAVAINALNGTFTFSIIGVEDSLSESLTPKKESISLYTKEKLTNRIYYN